jgi:hypothetical protein
VIRASSAAGTLDFPTVTVHQSSIGPVGALIIIAEPTAIDFGEVRAGTLLPGGAQMRAAIQAGSFSGQNLPGVGFRLADPENHDKPGPLGCEGGVVFSDAKGLATCNVRVGSQPGDYRVALIGGEQSEWSYHVKIVP